MAKWCLDRHETKYERHYAKVITQKDYEDFDEIYVMDSYNLKNINRMINDTENKIRMLDVKEIDDPWYTRDFEGVYWQINNAIDKLI